MSIARVSFMPTKGKRRVRGRILQFVSIGFQGVTAVVETQGRIIQINPDRLKVLRGR